MEVPDSTSFEETAWKSRSLAVAIPTVRPVFPFFMSSTDSSDGRQSSRW